MQTNDDKEMLAHFERTIKFLETEIVLARVRQNESFVPTLEYMIKAYRTQCFEIRESIKVSELTDG